MKNEYRALLQIVDDKDLREKLEELAQAEDNKVRARELAEEISNFLQLRVVTSGILAFRDAWSYLDEDLVLNKEDTEKWIKLTEEYLEVKDLNKVNSPEHITNILNDSFTYHLPLGTITVRLTR